MPLEATLTMEENIPVVATMPVGEKMPMVPTMPVGETKSMKPTLPAEATLPVETTMPVETIKTVGVKKGQPPIKKRNVVIRTRIIYKLRWSTMAIFVSVLVVQLFADWKLYSDCNEMFENIYVKGKETVLDVNKLRFDAYLKDFHKSYKGEEYNRRFENFKVIFCKFICFNITASLVLC